MAMLQTPIAAFLVWAHPPITGYRMDSGRPVWDQGQLQDTGWFLEGLFLDQGQLQYTGWILEGLLYTVIAEICENHMFYDVCAKSPVSPPRVFGETYILRVFLHIWRHHGNYRIQRASQNRSCIL